MYNDQTHPCVPHNGNVRVPDTDLLQTRNSSPTRRSRALEPTVTSGVSTCAVPANNSPKQYFSKFFAGFRMYGHFGPPQFDLVYTPGVWRRTFTSVTSIAGTAQCHGRRLHDDWHFRPSFPERNECRHIYICQKFWETFWGEKPYCKNIRIHLKSLNFPFDWVLSEVEFFMGKVMGFVMSCFCGHWIWEGECAFGVR